MNSELLLILDRALTNSLWVFLFSFLIILLYAGFRLRSRAQRVGDLYEHILDEEEKREIQRQARYRLNQWPIAMKALNLSLLVSLGFFLVFLFTPLPVFTNFSASDAWKITPLRVTAANYDRFYEGFSLTGEVWNQNDTAIEAKVKVTVIGADDKPLSEIETELEPSPLPPGTAGSFEIRYAENSPFIKGYQLSFVDTLGNQISHVVGFDAR